MSRPGPSRIMKFLRGDEGKGTAGCLFSLLILIVGILVAVKAGPPYFAYKSFESDVKTEISRAGAHFYDDELLMRNLLDLAKKNEIRLNQDEVKIERFAGQIFVTITYSVPLDLFVYQRDMDFNIAASSFIGRL
jgi:hypothetical protein